MLITVLAFIFSFLFFIIQFFLKSLFSSQNLTYYKLTEITKMYIFCLLIRILTFIFFSIFSLEVFLTNLLPKDHVVKFDSTLLQG